VNRRQRPSIPRPSISKRTARLLAAVCAFALIGFTTAASGSTSTQIRAIWVGNSQGRMRVAGTRYRYTVYEYCGAFNCSSGHSGKNWYPVIAKGQVVAGKNIQRNKLGTRKIKGQKVVTYWGNPLYRYGGDHKPFQSKGEAKTQGNGTWYLVNAKGGQALTKQGY
jgi:predicted lipoprotein with Yx(FWY)xxD motif